jgi:hypothetical protein
MLSELFRKYLEADDKYSDGSDETRLLWRVLHYLEKIEIEKSEPLSKGFKEYIDLRLDSILRDDYDLLIRVYEGLIEYEKQDKDRNSRTKGAIDDTDESQTTSEIELEAMRLTKECFQSAYELVFPKTSTDEICFNATTRLTEIMMDYIKSKQQIEAIEPLIEYFKPRVTIDPSDMIKNVFSKDGFKDLIGKIFGSMADNPIDKGEQGQSEKRVDIEYDEGNEKKTDSIIKYLEQEIKRHDEFADEYHDRTASAKADVLRKVLEFINSTMADDPIDKKDQGRSEKHVDVEYEKQEEKIVTSDVFTNKDEKEKPNICLHSIMNLQNAMHSESGGSLSMDVLCYDEMGNLGLAQVVTQVLYVIEQIGKHVVCRMVGKAESGSLVTKNGLLISA